MKRLLVVAVASLPPVAALADDYLGTLKPPQSSLTPGLYSFATGPAAGPATPLYSDQSVRLKLGYKYSRYLSVETEFVDFTRSPADVFASPGNLASAFRSTGFGVDTIATLPLWRFSFYGRMGAYRGERNGFGPYSTPLLGEAAARGTRVRYGLGMRYDFTNSFGIRAEFERYSPLGAQLASETETDQQFSLGVSWRF